MPEAYKQSYQTAIAPIGQKLGYRANFSGMPDLVAGKMFVNFPQPKDLKLFYSSGDFDKDGGNVWGCDDKDLYQAVLKGTKNEDASFNAMVCS